MTAPLDQATAILNGTLPVRIHAPRAAAWITRSALEDILRDLIRAKGVEPGKAKTRSLLSCIEVLYQDSDPQLPLRAQYAWDALSEACHHHAYELAPTVAEVRSLIDTVTGLRASAA